MTRIQEVESRVESEYKGYNVEWSRWLKYTPGMQNQEHSVRRLWGAPVQVDYARKVWISAVAAVDNHAKVHQEVENFELGGYILELPDSGLPKKKKQTNRALSAPQWIRHSRTAKQKWRGIQGHHWRLLK
jgi:hypothetical protein